MSAKPIVIQSCGKTKAEYPCKAYMLYQGSYFKAGLSYAQSITDIENYFIISAKYGLIRGTKIISPYDAQMGTPSQLVTQEQIIAQAKELNLNHASVLFIGGKEYLSYLRKAIDQVFFMTDLIPQKRMCFQISWFLKNKGKLPNEF